MYLFPVDDLVQSSVPSTLSRNPIIGHGLNRSQRAGGKLTSNGPDNTDLEFANNALSTIEGGHRYRNLLVAACSDERFLYHAVNFYFLPAI